MKEWRSQLESLMPAVELKFPPTPGFRPFHRYFAEESVAHPAKANLLLLYYLIKRYTKEGDTVLDPMAGTSSTAIIASLLGRNSVCVELEEKFVEWSKKNVECLERSGKKRGEIKIFQADARRLSELLGVQSDVAITSPPYKTEMRGSGLNKDDKGLELGCKWDGYSKNPNNIDNKPYGNISAIVTSPPYSGSVTGNLPATERRAERMRRAGYDPKTVLGGRARVAQIEWRYADRRKKDNIGNLPHGQIDSIITSPPYSESMTKKRKGYTIIPELAKTREMPQDTRDDNIANLPHGNVDTIITSPPYVNVDNVKEKSGEFWEKAKEMGLRWGSKPPTGTEEKQMSSPDNISNLPLGNVDAVITSPPYGEAQQGAGIAKRGYQGSKHSPTDLVGKRSYMPDKFENPENISKLPMGNIDAVITSPPYSDIAKSKEGAISPHMQGLISKLSGIPVKEFAHNVEKLKEAVKIAQSKIPFKYSDNQENIGNLPHGNIDAVITSPPYGEAVKAGSPPTEEEFKRALKKGFSPKDRQAGWMRNLRKALRDPDKSAWKGFVEGYSQNKENIGNLPFVDTVITSPPYEASVSDNKESPLVGADEKKYGRWRKGTARKHSYTQHGEPCKVDAVITSPPYEGSLEGTTRHTRGGIASRDPALAQTGSYATVMSFGVPVGYSPNPQNIGNLKSKDEEYEALAKIDCCLTSPPYEHSIHDTFEKRETWNNPLDRQDVRRKNLPVGFSENPQNIGNMRKETYLEAMLKVYGEMFRVLKPGGLAIIIVKPFVRHKKIVDLPYHTWLLMAKVGFKLHALYKLRLKQESFWRILFYKKHPNVPRITHEYVIVCRK